MSTEVEAIGQSEVLVPIRLVPVEVFGTDCDHPGCDDPNCGGYGLCDAVSSWSDCNRAAGRIYRVDDLSNREPGDFITVHVPQSALPWFEKRFGGDAPTDAPGGGSGG